MRDTTFYSLLVLLAAGVIMNMIPSRPCRSRLLAPSAFASASLSLLRLLAPAASALLLLLLAPPSLSGRMASSSSAWIQGTRRLLTLGLGLGTCASTSLLTSASACSSRVAPSCPPLSSSASTSLVAMYSTVQRGALHSPEYRLFIKDEQGRIVSPFHDIPLL